MANLRKYYVNELIQLYMDTITPQCREDRVDHMWTQILLYYFSIDQPFGIEREVYTAETELRRVDLVVTSVRGNQIYKTLFLEAKRHPAPSRAITPDAWASVRAQLQRNIDKWTDRNKDTTVFGLTAIGLYVKFFIIPKRETELRPFKVTDRPYSLRHDSERGHEILSQIKDFIAASL
ncbi:uncharacterized protein N7496_008743 [Penicillium cataractarum]|uniref:Uncharacterized protein n=1 Tax=Penicillium cataractarum TaxID=2100454 RepID=A0A9W9S3M1_9EURO|nr:uncharacterized protein N7496_008743 [Penicillium cataractarum]KAJ5368983.1 hypothetical protein N7496_008743 [Penicillium cataractarum]